VGLAVLASACTSKSGSPSAPTTSASGASSSSATVQPSAASSSSTVAAAPVKITATPAKRQDVNPVAPITVTAKNGTLNAVKLVNAEGKSVTGAMSADKTSWKATEVLGYSKSYHLTASAANSSGESVSKLSRQFTTLTPSNMTMPYLNNVYGSSIVNGATYGVGMIPVVHFDESVTNKKAAEAALKVTTAPHVDSDVHWRPSSFYKPGTKVTVAADVYGVNVGNGLYGQADQKTSFTIGASHISIANAKTHQVKVYFSGKMVRKMPTSMGQGGTVQGKNGPIYLWTMPGTYTVMNFENPAIMSSDSYGLPANSPLGYAPEKVYWSTKISTDGIYLHELDATVWAQGHQNLSHGCLNLNLDNAKWYFQHSRIGDVVQVVHSGGPKIQLFQGGDWSVPWSTWSKGNATA
jgi:lipoprotein-anchoring transpeptidase ErfK/SrfK